MRKNFQMFMMGLIVTILLILSNLAFELYPSTKYVAITFDSLLAIVLLRLAFKEIRKILKEESVSFVISGLVASLVVICLVVWLVA